MIRPGIRRLFRLALRRPDLQQEELDEEIRLHLELRVEQLQREGYSRERAHVEAVRRFGGVDQARRRLGHAAARRERRNRWRDVLEELRQDLRVGLRSLRKSPGFALVAVFTLALGIGANTAIFSVVDGVLLRALPFAEPDRLVSVWETSPTGDDRNIVSSGNYLDWQAQARSFVGLGAVGGEFGVTLTGVGDPVRVVGVQATPSTFRVLGVGARLGRVFTPDEEAPGSGNVILVSDGFWRRHLDGDPRAAGRVISLNGEPLEIVGVMPASFRFPSPETEFWFPRRFTATDQNQRRAHQWRVVARLRPGVMLEQAQAEVSALAARQRALYPEVMTGWGARVVPYRDDLVQGVRPLLLVLLAAVGLVLLVACANVANLMLARAAAREREVAVRAALGARRLRLVRQFMTESTLLALAGAAVALLFVFLGMDLLVALAPPDIPLLHEARVDLRVLGFAALLTLGSTILCGLLPALRASRADVQSTLRETGGPLAVGGHRRWRSGLLVFEVAVSVLLLIGAALLLRSFTVLLRADYGFNPERILTATVDLPFSRYAGSAAHVRFTGELVERVRALPGVVAADATTELPVVGYYNTFSFTIEDRPRAGPSNEEDPVPVRVVTGDYFRTMGIPVLQGRAFDGRDRADAPAVAAASASLARRFWPGGDAIGRRISSRGAGGPWIEIVGVVGDIRHEGLDVEPEPALYLPYPQKPWAWMSWVSLVVRTGADPAQLATAIRRELRAVDPDLAFDRMATIEAIYAESLARRRFATALIGGFAAVALTLGMVGIYGVLSYLMTQQRRDVGLRMALGARAGQVVGLVMRQGMVLAAGGVVLGLLGAIVLTRLLSGLLYQTSARDPLTFVLVPLLLLAVAAAACWLPARRAARVDPIRALRAD